MRLFIALDFEQISDYLSSLQEKLPSAKATFPKEFHLTLKFLGEVSESQAEEVKKKLKEIKFREINARLGKSGVFPNEGFIRVVWVGAEDGKKITELQQKIESALKGMFKEDDRFSPHITLARIKFLEQERKKEFAEAVNSMKIEPKEAILTKFKLIKSTLTPEGPVYETVEEFGAE